MTSPKRYSTRDLDQAAALVGEGHSLIGTTKDTRGRTLFHFKSTAGLEQSRLAFLTGKHQACAYFRARAALLGYVHSEREEI